MSIVRASGEIDLNNVHVLEAMLGRAINDGHSVLIDLREVLYMDSTALNVLIRTHEQCGSSDLTMAVVFTSSHLWRVFAVLSLQDIFAIFPSIDAALQGLSRTNCARAADCEDPEHPVSRRIGAATANVGGTISDDRT